MAEIRKMEQVGLNHTNLMKELEEEISTLEEKKESMAQRLEDNKVRTAEKSKEYQIKKREADEARITVAATKEMLRKRRGVANNHTQMLQILKEMTEVSLV